MESLPKTAVRSLHDRLTKVENIPFGIFNGVPEIVSCDGSPHVGSTIHLQPRRPISVRHSIGQFSDKAKWYCYNINHLDKQQSSNTMAETTSHLEEMEWKPTPPPEKPKLETGRNCSVNITSVSELALSIEERPQCFMIWHRLIRTLYLSLPHLQWPPPGRWPGGEKASRISSFSSSLFSYQ